MVRKAIIPLLALTVIALASPTATFARGNHHRTHAYGPPFDGYRPYADSCQGVRYRVFYAYSSSITCGWGRWAWWQQ